MSFYKGDITAVQPLSYPEQLCALTHLQIEGTVIALAKGLDCAVVVREDNTGQIFKSAIVAVSTVITLNDAGYIEADDPKLKIVRYRITELGKETVAGQGVSSNTPLRTKDVASAIPVKKCVYGNGDSILTNLSRRMDKHGDPFLSKAQLKAGERLKESFEIARLSHDLSNSWDETFHRSKGPPQTQSLQKLIDPLVAIGPGLADVVLGCCCFEEGLSDFEERQGWSARSAKIVLRIALQRLQSYYDSVPDESAMIG